MIAFCPLKNKRKGKDKKKRKKGTSLDFNDILNHSPKHPLIIHISKTEKYSSKEN